MFLIFFNNDLHLRDLLSWSHWVVSLCPPLFTVLDSLQAFPCPTPLGILIGVVPGRGRDHSQDPGPLLGGEDVRFEKSSQVMPDTLLDIYCSTEKIKNSPQTLILWLLSTQCF